MTEHHCISPLSYNVPHFLTSITRKVSVKPAWRVHVMSRKREIPPSETKDSQKKNRPNCHYWGHQTKCSFSFYFVLPLNSCIRFPLGGIEHLSAYICVCVSFLHESKSAKIFFIVERCIFQTVAVFFFFCCFCPPKRRQTQKHTVFSQFLSALTSRLCYVKMSQWLKIQLCVCWHVCACVCVNNYMCTDFVSVYTGL